MLSSIAVVGLHVSLPVFSPANTADWLVDVWFQACGIFAVPVFFLISGMNLLCYRERYSTKEFFIKRFKRVGVALLGGSVMCYLAYCLLPKGFYGAEVYAACASPTDFVLRFMTNQINDVYWFLYKIIYLYLLTPLISLALPNKRLMRYLISLSLVASVGIPLLTNGLGASDTLFNSLFAWALFKDTSVLYFLLGGYIGKYIIPTGRSNCTICVLAYLASSLLMGLWGLFANGWFNGELEEAYVSYPISVSSPLCVIQAVSLFLFWRNLEPSLKILPGTAHRVLSSLSKASLTVYLIHILFINATPGGRFLWLGNLIHSNIFVELLLAYLLSALIGVCLNRLKALCKKLALAALHTNNR